PFFRESPHVKRVTFTESSHMPHWEERERYMEVVGTFNGRQLRWWGDRVRIE
ncbi:hypothetical protein DFH09DRAFT_938902, partial [Mycena vulgaris]